MRIVSSPGGRTPKAGMEKPRSLKSWRKKRRHRDMSVERRFLHLKMRKTPAEAGA